MSDETKPRPTGPKRWKTAIIIWLGIYPTITTILSIIGPYLLPLDIPVWLKTLPITLLAVPIMVYVVLPILQRLFKNWLMN